MGAMLSRYARVVGLRDRDIPGRIFVAKWKWNFVPFHKWYAQRDTICTVAHVSSHLDLIFVTDKSNRRETT